MLDPTSPKYSIVAKYRTYDDYLITYVSEKDMYYLEDETLARILAELGYQAPNNFLSRDRFNELKAEHEQSKLERDTHTKCVLASEALWSSPRRLESESLLHALAEREQPNLDGRLATIIFLRHTHVNLANRVMGAVGEEVQRRSESSGSQGGGQHISGYVDFAHRLVTENWGAYFSGEATLLVRRSDLSYYNWKSHLVRMNHTDNWQVLADRIHGLAFKSKCDRKLLLVDPSLSSPGDSSMRTVLECPGYKQVVIYDHVIRLNI